MLFVPKNNLAAGRHHIVRRASAVSLADFSAARREATRPLAFRGPDFDRQFDDTTLVYEAVEIGGAQTVLFAPPLFNLADEIARTEFHQGSRRLNAEIRPFDRHAQIWLRGSAEGMDIRATGPLGDFTIRAAPDDRAIFHDRRVIFTMSKDNPIEWILDWVRFNRDIHGADAVLIYDNGSTAYDGATLSAALQTVSGIERSAVVEWPFKYGPQGANSWEHWDSDFCQLGAWEHARWRFLQDARAAMNSDVDEFVVSKAGCSVFEAAEQSAFGFVRYHGRWIIGVNEPAGPDVADRLPRHRDFSVLMPPDQRFSWRRGWRDMNRCQPKWTVVPSKCPAHVQWHVHSIASWLPSRLPTSREFSFRHFREIGSNWKYQRTSRVPFDPSIHRTDALLTETLTRVAWAR
jgi:hypothetical protein